MKRGNPRLDVKRVEEIASKCTGLSDEDNYNIIKTIVGMLNAKKA